MHNPAKKNPILALEETLVILEECLQGDNSVLLDSAMISSHIKTLKHYYSPEFDFDYSETGSYFYAALNSIHRCYIESDACYQLDFTDIFKASLQHLLCISRLSINYRTYKHTIVDHLLALAKLWRLQHAMDMRILMLQTLALMRSEVNNLGHQHYPPSEIYHG